MLKLKLRLARLFKNLLCKQAAQQMQKQIAVVGLGFTSAIQWLPIARNTVSEMCLWSHQLSC